ncbi:hypothetical protein AAF712_015094, partial [Marasmius tenuissimus]
MSSTPTSSRPPSPTGTATLDATTPIAITNNYRFRYAESVSGTTNNEGAYVTAGNNPPLNLHFNASALGLDFGDEGGGGGVVKKEWSSSRDGFHAISTVLNNPHKKQAPPKAHSSLGGAAVGPAELPRVRRKDFDGYLRAVGDEWERFRGPMAMTTTDDSDQPTPLPGNLPPLETIPSIFFDTSFDLSDPKTFASVSESEDPTSLSHSLPLQEKLSHYLDTLEIHLSHEISLRSSSFFTALSNLQLLHSESTTCLSQITRLRGMLQDVDGRIARSGLEVVRLEQKIRGIEKVEEGLKGVEGVVGVTGQAREKVSKGEWESALGVLGVLDGMWEGKKTDSKTPVLGGGGLETLNEEEEGEETTNAGLGFDIALPLSSLNAFSALPGHLRTLTMEIASRLSSELVQILQSDFTRYVETQVKNSNKEDFKEELSRKLRALLRTKGLKEATLSWREVVLGELSKWVVGKTFDSTEDGGDLRRRLSQSYADIIHAIDALQSQTNTLLELVEYLKRMHPTLVTPDLIPTLTEDLQSLLTQFTSLTHTSLASQLTSNQTYLTSMSLDDFVAIYKETHKFVVDCEVRCKCMVVALRGGLGSVAKQWLNAFHQSRLNQQAKAVEDEVWNATEVGDDVQGVVKVIVDGAVGDAGLLALEGQSMPVPPTPTPATPATPTPATPSTAKKPTKHLRIDSHTYHTVPCTSSLLFLLTEYLRLPPSIALLTTDVMSRTMEFLKTFNSRVCQVVLGAGAMRSAGLKNITARHLALASQSLSIMIALIPYVREMFRRHLSQKQAVMLVEFDKLKRDYQEHQNEIHAKLIAIMGDRLSAHIKSLQAVDWTLPPKSSGSSGGIVVNDYMELLVKETVTLHKVLSRYLSPGVVE